MFRLKTTATSKRAWKLLTTIYEGSGKRFNEAINAETCNYTSKAQDRRRHG